MNKVKDNPEVDAAAVGKRIKLTRLEADLTQEALSKKIGITKAALSRIELGINYPRIVNLVAMSRILEVSIDWLITGAAEETPGGTARRMRDYYEALRKEGFSEEQALSLATAPQNNIQGSPA